MSKSPSDLHLITSLIDIVATLRGPNGCPWDKEQTHLSLTQYVIEEAYELVEAIENFESEKSDQNLKKLKEELGDVLFQVIINTQLANEQDYFNFSDVIEDINKKMIRRHPHVFGEETAETSGDVMAHWIRIKSEEKLKEITDNPEKLNYFNIPIQMPALQRSSKIGDKSAQYKFDWTNINDVWKKLTEEFNELKQAFEENDPKALEHEIGDMFFSLCQFSRHLKMEPEQVARKANKRFENRFMNMVHLAQKNGLNFFEMSEEDKEIYWNRAKALEKI